MNILKINSGAGVVRHRILGPHDIVIGRHDDCEIQLDDLQASRQHAQVVFRDDGYLIEDLGSSNGTHVNAAPISAPTRLNDGDEIRIGSYSLKYQVRDVDEFDLSAELQSESTMIYNPDDDLIVSNDTARQLDKASAIQRALLPTRSPATNKLDFYSYYSPMESIGGDYFDYIELPGDRLAVVVGDVVGHGIDAAVVMSRFSAEARNALKNNRDPSAAVRELNRSMAELEIEHFITTLIGVIDLNTLEIEVVNAGHMPPIVLGVDGSIELIKKEKANFPIGVVPDSEFPGISRQINRGERLVMYTDGLTEQKNIAGEMFESERLEQLIRDSRELEQIDAFGENLIQQHQQFFNGCSQADDICVVCIGRLME